MPSLVVTGIAFEVAATSMPRNSASASQVFTPGVSTSLGLSSVSGKIGGARLRRRHLDVSREVAVLAGDERVLAGPGRGEKVDRLRAAHHSRLGVDRLGDHADAIEDPVVGGLLELEAAIEARRVAVERVGVLHDELAQPDEPLPGTRLVAFLDREVVEHLRQQPVARELAGMEADGLLVRQRQHEVGALAVLQPEHLLDVVASGRLPELERRQHRHQHLLRADRVHLLADDLLDLPVDPPAERQERPDTGGHLTDEAAAHEQLVIRRLGVGRRVAQRG